MRFINSWSYKCSHYLARQLNENHEKRRVFYFGFQVVIGAIVKGILLASLSLLLGVFWELIVTTVFFAFIRLVSGGYHMDTYGKCMIVSFAIFLAIGLIVKHTGPYWPVWLLIILTAVIFAIGMFVMIKWAPGDTHNKPITKPDEIRKFKRLSIINMIIWVIINSILIYFDQKMHAAAGCLGTLLAIFIVTPAGYRFFDMLSGKMSSKKKHILSTHM